MGYWPQHPRKELEALLKEFDKAGWRLRRGKKYYRVLCPCGQHAKAVHITPSGRYYANHVRQWLRQLPCYESEDRQ